MFDTVLQQLSLNMLPAETDKLRKVLAAHINDLLLHDFSKLVQLLYRLDVSEKKLRQLLHDQPGQDAGELIAGLIIERQLEKLKTRQQFRSDSDGIAEEDRW